MANPPDKEHPRDDFPIGCKVKDADNSGKTKRVDPSSHEFIVTGYKKLGGNGNPVYYHLETEVTIDGKTRKGRSGSPASFIRID